MAEIRRAASEPVERSAAIDSAEEKSRHKEAAIPEEEHKAVVDILPIPPALEFPYPGSSAVSTNEPTQDVTTPGLLENLGQSAREPIERLRRYNTEKPKATNRPDLASTVRGQTYRHEIYKPGVWDSDSDGISSTSSSDEEDESATKPKSGIIKDKLSRAGKKGGRARKNTLPDDDPYSKFALGNDDYRTKGHVSKNDGRLKISLKEVGQKGYLAKALGATLKRQIDNSKGKVETLAPPHGTDRKLSGTTATSTPAERSPERTRQLPVPILNIVIMVIGSRGDIQPFLKLGKILKDDYGHRVRMATHPAFKDFVEKEAGLEFFSVGGDPAELMAFMVKNPGLIPKTETIRSGEIGKRRETMYEMFKGLWRACINATDDETDIANLKMMGNRHPFVADAIIANPVCFAHVHCAERLGIPLHLMFTFPVSPTQQFPHPLANIKKSNVEANYTNFMSYPLVDMMQWQGLGDLINKFRCKVLGLEPMSTLWAPGQLFRLRVPITYLWSPALIPKPADWGPEINIAGFVFLDLASSFKPPDDLTKFLEAGDCPVYIGFGSIVVDEPDKFTKLIFDAVKAAGARALVSKGWGGLGGDDTPDNIFMLENTPHDWLFPRVSAVVHHGGAGTTAIGLKCGKPTMIVPFFGDQPFWGSMVAKAGAGAEPVPYKKLTAERLADGIKTLLKPETQEAAKSMAKKIEDEGDGAKNAIKYFLNSLPMTGNHCMRCSILEDRIAVWWLKSTHMRLSALAAEMLVRQGKIKWNDLRLIRHYEWQDFEGPGEPVTGAGMAVASSVASAVHGVASTPFRWAKTIKDGHNMRDRKNTDEAGKEFPTAEEGISTATNEAVAETERVKPSGTTYGPAKHHPAGSPLAGIFEENIATDLTKDTGHGLAKSGRAIARAPMDLSLALARGFHNAPRLYGDDTVRTPRRITGLKSGLRTAGEEFRHGVYDGWTGVVTQPYKGMKEEGPVGLLTGCGKGIGGFVLKDLAALWALPAYSMKGVYEEIIKSRQPTKFIRRARILAGQKDLVELESAKVHEADNRIREAWKVILALQREIQIARSKGIKGRIAIHKGKQKWKKYGIFESTEQTKKALDAYRAGKSLEMAFGTMPVAEEGHNAPKDHLVESKEKRKARKAEKRRSHREKKDAATDEALIEAAQEEERTQPEAVEKGDALRSNVTT